MNITEDDVGRLVKLRNGSHTCIIEWDKKDHIHPVKVRASTNYYSGWCKNNGENIDDDFLDIVEFLDTKSDPPKKYDDNKSRIDLVRPEFINAIGQALAYGANKYDEVRGETPNYLKGKGFEYSKLYASAQRHLTQWFSGVNIDEESGLHHLQLAATNLMFLYTYEISNSGIDDRVTLHKKGTVNEEVES